MAVFLVLKRHIFARCRNAKIRIGIKHFMIEPSFKQLRSKNLQCGTSVVSSNSALMYSMSLVIKNKRQMNKITDWK
jgi:uncharacterized membrane protein